MEQWNHRMRGSPGGAAVLALIAAALWLLVETRVVGAAPLSLPCNSTIEVPLSGSFAVTGCEGAVSITVAAAAHLTLSASNVTVAGIALGNSSLSNFTNFTLRVDNFTAAAANASWLTVLCALMEDAALLLSNGTVAVVYDAAPRERINTTGGQVVGGNVGVVAFSPPQPTSLVNVTITMEHVNVSVQSTYSPNVVLWLPGFIASRGVAMVSMSVRVCRCTILLRTLPSTWLGTVGVVALTPSLVRDVSILLCDSDVVVNCWSGGVSRPDAAPVALLADVKNNGMYNVSALHVSISGLSIVANSTTSVSVVSLSKAVAKANDVVVAVSDSLCHLSVVGNGINTNSSDPIGIVIPQNALMRSVNIVSLGLLSAENITVALRSVVVETFVISGQLPGTAVFALLPVSYTLEAYLFSCTANATTLNVSIADCAFHVNISGGMLMGYAYVLPTIAAVALGEGAAVGVEAVLRIVTVRAHLSFALVNRTVPFSGPSSLWRSR
jgi:hypothetical protein